MRRLWPTGGLWRHARLPEAVVGARRSASSARRSRSSRSRSSRSSCSTRPTFEVAALGVVEFLPFILFTLPAGVWVDRLPRRPILIAGDFGRAALLATIPIAYVADVLTLGQLYVVGFLVGIVHGLLRRRVPVVPPVARRARADHRRELEARDQPVGGADRRARASRASSSQIFTAPYAVLVDADQLPRLGALPPPDPEARGGAAAVAADGRAEAEPVDGAQGRAPLRARQPEPPRAGGLHGDVELLLRTLAFVDPPRVPRPRARALAGRDRVVFSILGASARWSPRSLRRAISGALRDRPDDDRGDACSRARRLLLIALAPAGNAAIPFLVVAAAPPRVRSRRLQHRPGQLPAGDLPAAAPGTHELRHALHRLGDDPARRARRRRARRRWIGLRETIVVGAVGGGLVLPLDPALAAAPPARDARAGRRRRSPGSGRARTDDSRYRHRMPELPEVEAWVRELDPLVSRSPIDRPGPRTSRR